MRTKTGIGMASAALAMLLALAAAAGTSNGKDKDKDKDAPPAASTAAAATVHTTQNDAENVRFEGEKRFHANCGRCHAAPPKFSPRMAATIVRHMRVRATITQEEAHSILQYLAQ